VLTGLEHPDAKNKAVEMLDDPNEVVRAAAASAVATLRLEKATARLDGMVLGEQPDPSEAVQNAALEALALLNSRS